MTLGTGEKGHLAELITLLPWHRRGAQPAFHWSVAGRQLTLKFIHRKHLFLRKAMNRRAVETKEKAITLFYFNRLRSLLHKLKVLD